MAPEMGTVYTNMPKISCPSLGTKSKKKMIVLQVLLKNLANNKSNAPFAIMLQLMKLWERQLRLEHLRQFRLVSVN